MDVQSGQRLARMVRGTRVAALGTLRDGAPLVSMVIYSSAPSLNEFYVHASRLAQHTQDMLHDKRVSLMIAEADEGRGDPLTLARISIRGEAEVIPASDPAYEQAKSLHLRKFPLAEQNFLLGDFSLYRISPRSARFIAGFGRIFNLTGDQLTSAAQAADAAAHSVLDEAPDL